MISRYSLLICLVFLLAASACKKSENINYITYNYSGAGTIGDVLTFSVNESVMGYTVYNLSLIHI